MYDFRFNYISNIISKLYNNKLLYILFVIILNFVKSNLYKKYIIFLNKITCNTRFTERIYGGIHNI